MAATKETKKPTPGHKCQGISQWIEIACECGWRSDMVRRSEQAGVYSQWREHVAKCVEVRNGA